MTSPRFISSFKRHSPSASLWRHTHTCTQACIQSYVQTAYWSSSCNLFSSLKNVQLYSISVINWDNWNNAERWLLPCAVWYCFCPSCQSLCLSFLALSHSKPSPEHTIFGKREFHTANFPERHSTERMFFKRLYQWSLHMSFSILRAPQNFTF